MVSAVSATWPATDVTVLARDSVPGAAAAGLHHQGELQAGQHDPGGSSVIIQTEPLNLKN